MIAATFVWGATFLVVQRAIAAIPVLHLLALRFALGAAVVALFADWRGLRATGKRRDRVALLRDGVAGGVLLWGGYVLQTYGLLFTTPARSAFVTALSVVLVPLLLWSVPGGRRPRRRQLGGCLAALCGLWLLFQPAGQGGAEAVKGFGFGDLLTVGCAVVFTGYILVAERSVRRQPLLPLASVQFATVALLCAPAFVVVAPSAGLAAPAAWGGVLITGLLATAAAFLGQLFAQRHLAAVETAVWLTLEPVFAALLSVLAGADRLTWPLLAGGALILAAMALVSADADASAEAAEATIAI